MKDEKLKLVALIVAHPDDETLWAGGTMLSHSNWKCIVVCLCRGSDAERAKKFYNANIALKSVGIMGDLDDGPDQVPLKKNKVEHAILELLPSIPYDLIITHNTTGEYTKHLRHEEISISVIELWKNAKISAKELWTFAYEDGNRHYYPRNIKNAHIFMKLTWHIWLKKYRIITKLYGFKKNSWEAKTTPKEETFWQINF